MKGTESGKDKVKKICDVLRRETLEPARNEAEDVIQSAKNSAAEIIKAAETQAEKIIQDAGAEIQRQKNVFQSSLNQACSLALESLKQSIQSKVFNPELSHLISRGTQDPKVLARLIEAVIEAIGKDGVDADLSVYIPAAIPAREVNALLAREVIEKLKEKSVLVGMQAGGIEIKVHNHNITIDVTDAALREIVANYIRKDFRELIFGN